MAQQANPRYSPELLHWFNQNRAPTRTFGQQLFHRYNVSRQGPYIVYLLRARPVAQVRAGTDFADFLSGTFYVGISKYRGRPLEHIVEALNGGMKPKHIRIKEILADPTLHLEAVTIAEGKSELSAKDIEAAVIEAYGGPLAELTNEDQGQGPLRASITGTADFHNIGVRALTDGYRHYLQGGDEWSITYIP